MAILKDTSEDSEIRTAAYLQTMTCPTSDLLTQIQILMEDEAEDSQVCVEVQLRLLLLLLPVLLFLGCVEMFCCRELFLSIFRQ